MSNLLQILEQNLDAKEEREMLLIENLRQAELIQKLEKTQETMAEEVSLTELCNRVCECSYFFTKTRIRNCYSS
jgi:hypothetical protein